MNKFLSSLFEKQHEYINYFFNHIDMEKVEEIFEALLTCSGVLIFTGVGKSGIIGQKIAMTLLSTGTKSLYLPPIDALHGDLGIVTEKDIFLFLSKSGETQELLSLIPYIRRKGAKLIGIVSKPNSRLAKQCDLSICLPLKRELCPFDLAPTTSTVIQLIFGDVLAVALMEKKNFSLDDYALNHPAGAIGKKISLYVKDLMIKKEGIPLCHPEDRLIEVLHELSAKRCGCLIAVNEKRELKGIFTDGDLRRAIQNYGPKALDQKLAVLMTKTPKSVSKNELAFHAMKMMEENPCRLITVLPVIENKKVVGILRMHDILQEGLNSSSSSSQ